MHVVGVIEIVAGVAVAIKPRYAAYIVAAWLAGIVTNLLSYSGYYDIALRDFALMLAALTLGRLASKSTRPGFRTSRTCSTADHEDSGTRRQAPPARAAPVGIRAAPDRPSPPWRYRTRGSHPLPASRARAILGSQTRPR